MYGIGADTPSSLQYHASLITVGTTPLGSVYHTSRARIQIEAGWVRSETEHDLLSLPSVDQFWPLLYAGRLRLQSDEPWLSPHVTNSSNRTPSALLLISFLLYHIALFAQSF